MKCINSFQCHASCLSENIRPSFHIEDITDTAPIYLTSSSAYLQVLYHDKKDTIFPIYKDVILPDPTTIRNMNDSYTDADGNMAWEIVITSNVPTVSGSNGELRIKDYNGNIICEFPINTSSAKIALLDKWDLPDSTLTITLLTLYPYP